MLKNTENMFNSDDWVIHTTGNITNDIYDFLNEKIKPPVMPQKYNVIYLRISTKECIPVLKKYVKTIYESSNGHSYIMKVPKEIPIDLILSIRGILKADILFEESN